MNLNETISLISEKLWGWPLIIIFMVVGIITTVVLNFVQFRYLLQSFKIAFFSRGEKSTGAEISPFQAFLSALGASTGNGSIAGIATAIYSGGPGAGFWILIAGMFSLVMRFAEVFLATSITQEQDVSAHRKIGGPMAYLQKVPFGKFLTYVYAVLALLFGFIGGSAMQSNSIVVGINRTWGFDKLTVSIVLFLFIVYVLSGGAQRIINISDKLVPFKVILFFVSAIIVLCYHYNALIPAIKLMALSALTPQAVGGAVLGFTIQQALRGGVSKTLNANEAGLGSAAIFFGASRSKNPMRDSVMSMLSTFISTYIVCFGVALSIVASGVWNNGQTSTALTISAYETVFGQYGGWIVTLCSASFGLGVLVPFAFLTREVWLFLTKGRWQIVFSILFCLGTLFGGIAKVDLVWNSLDIVNALMFLINMYAIVYLLPFIRKNVNAYIKSN